MTMLLVVQMGANCNFSPRPPRAHGSNANYMPQAQSTWQMLAAKKSRRTKARLPQRFPDDWPISDQAETRASKTQRCPPLPMGPGQPAGPIGGCSAVADRRNRRGHQRHTGKLRNANCRAGGPLHFVAHPAPDIGVRMSGVLWKPRTAIGVVDEPGMIVHRVE